ncbi:MAG: phosphoribosylanthranilate isomerase [Candidatus Latescibacteria bacterium]|nr:phosphoribosylanthranilate isomerase [Candidatus Latescibacterota bacterium]
MIRVKICRMTSLDDALYAVECGADAVGFIFYPKAAPYIPPDRAAQIVRGLPPFVTPVGVFVDEPHDRVAGVAGTVGIRAVQLHGDESPEYCRRFPGLRVIKAFRIGENFDVKRLAAYQVDAFLLDAYDPKLRGGTGRTFNWDIAVEARRYGRIILSGGLNPDNVADAVAKVRPYAVDVGSGVEVEPGHKDHEKVAAFIRAARRSDG